MSKMKKIEIFFQDFFGSQLSQTLNEYRKTEQIYPSDYCEEEAGTGACA